VKCSSVATVEDILRVIDRVKLQSKRTPKFVVLQSQASRVRHSSLIGERLNRFRGLNGREKEGV
jgi:aspartokinase